MMEGASEVRRMVEEKTGRKLNNTTLKYWSDTGRISRTAIHAKFCLYDSDEVIAAALTKTRQNQRSTLGKLVTSFSVSHDVAVS